MPDAPLAPSAAALGREGATELDPELEALPPPPRQARWLSLAILALAAVAAFAAVGLLWLDVTYAVRGSAAVALGELAGASEASLRSNENRFVAAEGALASSGGVRYGRYGTQGTFQASPVAGRRDVWVEVRTSDADGARGSSAPSRRPLRGRLVRFGATGATHRGLSSAIERATREALPDPAWLLVDDAPPDGCRWAIAAAATFLAFALWHLSTIARMLRRVR